VIHGLTSLARDSIRIRWAVVPSRRSKAAKISESFGILRRRARIREKTRLVVDRSLGRSFAASASRCVASRRNYDGRDARSWFRAEVRSERENRFSLKSPALTIRATDFAYWTKKRHGRPRDRLPVIEEFKLSAGNSCAFART